MADTPLYLAIGVPVHANAAMLTLMATLPGARITSLETNFNARFASLEAHFELLTGKVAELTDRVTRLEERTRQLNKPCPDGRTPLARRISLHRTLEAVGAPDNKRLGTSSA